MAMADSNQFLGGILGFSSVCLEWWHSSHGRFIGMNGLEMNGDVGGR